MRMSRLTWRIVLLVFICVGLIASSRTVFSFDLLGGEDKEELPFVRRDGARLMLGLEEVHLRGMNFQNDLLHSPDWSVWTRDPSDDTYQPITDWYSERHVQEVKGLGMNAIRFMMNYRLFEDNSAPYVYKDSGWAFIDQYIEWAKNQDVYLILDMHVPQGGLQTTRQGAALWDVAENRNRLKALWGAIAERYADEPRIAAYDLVNEPSPTEEPAQWSQLAQEIVDEIRLVDTNHLLIVEHVNWLIRADGTTPITTDFTLEVLESFQFTVDDQNVMYDFHFYWPMLEYQHLGVWRLCGGGGNYPDEGVAERSLDGQSLACGRGYLEHQLALYLDFAETNNVPMNVGEWGGGIEGSLLFQNSGGLAYVGDMLDLFDENGVNWQYYSQNELYLESEMTNLVPSRTDVFSSYFNDGGGEFSPADVNTDGQVNAVDVQLVINAALGLDIGALDADLSDDGAIDAVDVQLVINAALGL